MSKKECDFMLGLAELMAKYGVSIEATMRNSSADEIPSIRIETIGIETIQRQDLGESIDIDLFGCLYSTDIKNLAKKESPHDQDPTPA